MKHTLVLLHLCIFASQGTLQNEWHNKNFNYYNIFIMHLFKSRSKKPLRRSVPSKSSHTVAWTSTSCWTCPSKFYCVVLYITDSSCLSSIYSNQLVELMHSRARRRFSRGLKRKPMALIKKLRKAKKEAPPNEKPEIVKTHLRNMIIVPEMTGSIIGVYNGKDFTQVIYESYYILCLLCYFTMIFSF